MRWVVGTELASPPTPPARSLHAAAAILSAAVLADSAIEHYRGSFRKRSMVAALGASSVAMIGGLAATLGGTTAGLAKAAYTTALAAGLLGTGFHLRNLTRPSTGPGWNELFYRAPFGAPSALALAGLLGLAATRLDETPAEEPPALLGLPTGRVLAGLVSIGLLGAAAEVALLHFRGSFQNRAMYLPVILPPAAGLLMAGAALGDARPRPLTKLAMLATAGLGLAGSGFHTYGISRAMGGWGNWRQNLVDGPPVPAPPSFTGLAIAGLAALQLMRAPR